MVISGKNEPFDYTQNQTQFDVFSKIIESCSLLTESSEKFLINFEKNICPEIDNLKSSISNTELKSKDDVLEEINQDIKNFKEILTNAILPTLKLETVFFNRVEQRIILLLSNLDSQEMTSFILDSLENYLENDYANIGKQVQKYENIQDILKVVDEVLKENES